MLELWLMAIVLLFVPYAYLPYAIIGVLLLALPKFRARWNQAPFIPTGKKTADVMFRFSDVQKGERVYDLGCGDGRFVRRAALLGARATGVEASFLTSLLARIVCVGVRGASIRFGDLWKGDYRDADVIFCYLLTTGMHRFEREIWPTLKPGTRVISNAFRMKDTKSLASSDGVHFYRKGE